MVLSVIEYRSSYNPLAVSHRGMCSEIRIASFFELPHKQIKNHSRYKNGLFQERERSNLLGTLFGFIGGREQKPEAKQCLGYVVPSPTE